MARSNSGTTSPGESHPSSPPLALLPSSENWRASWAKSALFSRRSLMLSRRLRASASGTSSLVRMRMWRARVWLTITGVVLPRRSLSIRIWKPLALRSGALTAPGAMVLTASRNSDGRREASRHPMAPPWRASGASEKLAATCRKSAPDLSCESAWSTRARRAWICSGLAFSGTVTRMCARLYSSPRSVCVCWVLMKLSISLSVTTMRLSTSRSRSRAITISSRMSSRNFWNGMPSFSIAARRPCRSSLFSAAMRCSARSSSVSSTRSPVSLANWSWTLVEISRSSTCRSSTSRGGGGVPWLLSCAVAIWVRLVRSARVITSLFTTATTRSITTTLPGGGSAPETECGAAQTSPSASAPARHARRVRTTRCAVSIIRIARFIGRGCPGVHSDITADIVLERVHRIGADTRYPVQLQLYEKRRGGLLRRHREAVGHHAQRPAVAIVFRADQSFEGALVEQGIVPPGERRPALRDGPLGRDVGLAQHVGRLAIAQVEDLARLGLVAGSDVELLGLGEVGAVLPARIGGPVRGDRAGDCREQVGAGAGAHRHAGKGDLLGLEIVALRYRAAHHLGARLRSDQARRDAVGHLVGVVDPVPARELVLGKNGRHVDVLLAAVEYRDAALVAERDVQIIGARLQRLQEGRAADPGGPFEHHAAVDAEDRQGARGALVEADAVRLDVVARHVEPG